MKISPLILLGPVLLINPGCAKKDLLPNIIIILADDLGYGDLSCYGQKTLKTPHLDHMAAEGMLFTNHYAGSTVSAPSRASLLTGLHTGHVSVRGNAPPQLLRDDELTLAGMLKSAGYVTGAVGKWGVGHPPPPDDPQKKGFDYFFGYINMWHAHNFYPEFLYRNGEKVMLEGNGLHSENGENPWVNMPEGTGVSKYKTHYAPHLLETEALEFIEKNRDTTFFLYLAFNIPHANNEAGRYLGDGMEVEDYGSFAEKPWPDPEKGFARMIQYMDETVGKINNKLKESGIENNTLVIFTSDNGPHNEGNHSAEFFSSSGGLKGNKRDLYEGGIRVPFIAKWPGRIPAGSRSDHISAFWDFLPTIAEIAGLPPPQNIDGISFLPSLLNKKTQKKHYYLYWEFYELGGRRAIRKDQWKAVQYDIRKNPDGYIMLFDVINDPGEEHDLAEEHPEIVREMKLLMTEAHTPTEIWKW